MARLLNTTVRFIFGEDFTGTKLNDWWEIWPYRQPYWGLGRGNLSKLRREKTKGETVGLKSPPLNSASSSPPRLK